MNYEIVELEELSGSETGIYSVLEEGDELTLFDHFVDENKKDHTAEVKAIVDRLISIGSKDGARDIYFKFNEGNLGDGVCALYDDPDRKLRLYCMRCGKDLIILGGGGPKPKNVRAYQDDFKLDKEAGKIKQVAKDIMTRIKEKELRWSSDCKSLIGNLIFTDNEDE